MVREMLHPIRWIIIEDWVHKEIILPMNFVMWPEIWIKIDDERRLEFK